MSNLTLDVESYKKLIADRDALKKTVEDLLAFIAKVETNVKLKPKYYNEIIEIEFDALAVLAEVERTDDRKEID